MILLGNTESMLISIISHDPNQLPIDLVMAVHARALENRRRDRSALNRCHRRSRSAGGVQFHPRPTIFSPTNEATMRNARASEI